MPVEERKYHTALNNVMPPHIPNSIGRVCVFVPAELQLREKEHHRCVVAFPTRRGGGGVGINRHVSLCRLVAAKTLQKVLTNNRSLGDNATYTQCARTLR